ncbi:MAG: NADH-quinone oxidoreductase subunit M, partial [Prevotella sp.]|nr:NADH-quinone oxidoreductase subunit M [Prevotella sp.]
MNILSLFVVIPVLMLLGLWIARNLNQVRGVMVAGASCLLALSVWLTYYFVTERAAGNTDEMLLVSRIPWFKPLNIEYAVGIDGISVVMLLLALIIVFTGTF